MTDPTRTPAHAAAATLACLRDMHPGRLRALLTEWPDPCEALDAVCHGHAQQALIRMRMRPDLAAALARRWHGCSPGPIVDVLDQRGTHVWLLTDANFPIPDAIPDRPFVLFGEGRRPDVFEQDRIAIVGTRAASPSGLADAHLLGAAFATTGATVVSGLALGIDGAAHRGALSTGTTVAVVATGLDIVYPRRHAALAAQILDQGLIVSESGFGVGPVGYRFPIRNRIIAGLASAVVVVEATATGGARITAEHGLDYGRPVFAMPGARRNPAAIGTNQLIRDGASPLLDPSDVWVSLGLPIPAGLDDTWMGTPTPRDRAGLRALPDGVGPVLDAIDGSGSSVDQIVGRTGMALTDVAEAIRALADADRIVERRGQWWLV